MKVLVLGGTGLLGSSLTKILVDLNYYVSVLIRPSSKEKFKNIIKDRYEKIKNVIECDLLTSYREIDLGGYDAIFYLVQSRNYRNFPDFSEEIMMINTFVPIVLAKKAMEVGVSKFVYASTGGVYESSLNSKKNYKEEIFINVNKDINFYSASKLSAEVLLRNFAQYFETFIILRPYFIYGPYQNLNMLIPRLIKNIVNEEIIYLEGREGIKINPIYVEDASCAVAKTISLKGFHVINIAGKEKISIKKLCMMISKVLERKSIIRKVKFSYVNKKPRNLCGDITKMTGLLHNPIVSLEEGLTKTIDFILPAL